MTHATEVDFGRRVAEAIKQLDYDVTTSPSRGPGQGSLPGWIYSWLMEPPSLPVLPDMLVTLGEKAALVEVKAYPVLLGPIIQAKHFADYFEVPAIVCVPDDAFQEIPHSVLEWAEAHDVVLSSIGEIGDKLRVVLRQTSP